MIIPSKHLKESEALIGVGSTLLSQLSSDRSLSELWENVKGVSNIGNFERFVLGLDLLFVLGLIELKADRVIKVAT